MHTPRVSIIIPVYNARQYILPCLESIVRQTFSDYEVILLDDGSKDDSAKIVTEFITNNQLHNFSLVSKENGGVSSARNLGLKLAKGEWIAFIDSDDWVEPCYLQNMMQSIDQYDAEFCLCGFDAYEMADQRFDPWSSYVLEFGKLPEDLSSLTSFDYVWGRLYKKSILDAHRITFDEQIFYCEDNAFNFDYISAIHSFSCVHEMGYHYRRGHTGALSKSLVQPKMRVHFVEHAKHFCNAFEEEVLISTLEKNTSFRRIMWNVLSTAVIVDILDKNYPSARKRMSESLAQAIIRLYKPYTKKERVILFFWKHSFLGLRLIVQVYYKHFEEIKKHKRFFAFISH